MNLKKLTRIILLVAVLLLLSIVPVSAVVYDNGAFDSDYYLSNNGDVVAVLGTDPATAYNHYRGFGIKEGRAGSPVFDVAYYVSVQSDLAGMDYETAYNHFINFGMNEGRTASRTFDVKAYLAKYDDVRAVYGEKAYASAFAHYIYHGISEGRDGLGAGATVPGDHTHAYEISKVLIAASCISDGEAVYTCECGDTKTDVIKASADYHDYQKVATEGNVEVYKCSICNDTYSKVVTEEAHEHEYAELEDNRIEATCTAEGKIFKQCTECGDMIEEKIPMIDHVSSTPLGQGKITVGVENCTKDGAEEVTCDVCREKFTRTISAHSFEKVSEVAATCTEEGVTTYKCKNCETTKVDVAKKIDHTYTSEVVVTPADCEHDGLTLKVCKVCGEEKRTVEPKTEHTGAATKGWANVDTKGNYILTDENGDFDSSKIDTAKTTADCEHDVIEAYECDTCNKIQVKVVAKKLGHRVDNTQPVTTGTIEYKNGVPVVDAETGYIVVNKGAKADCTHDEVKVFTCANCDVEKVVVITEKLDHNALAGSEKVFGATCEEDGYKTFTCTTCNEKITEETGEKALGHHFAFVPETCTEKAKIACTRGCELDAEDEASEEYVAFKATLSQAQKDALAKDKADGHNLIGEIKVVNGEDCKYCSKCGKWIPVSSTSTQHVHATDLSGKSITGTTGAYKVSCGADCGGINVSWDGSATTVEIAGVTYDVDTADGNKLSKKSVAPAHVHNYDNVVGKTLTGTTGAYTVSCGDDCEGIEVTYTDGDSTCTINGETYGIDAGTKVIGAKQS